LRLQPIYDIAEQCARQGINQAVLCPGSRSAPLTLAFTRHENITCRTFSDERSAAFVALGIAQQTKMPSILVCTSGSAAYNFAPAVAEAFFQEIPVLIFTADRPKEWIDQLDGQTIRQNNLYGSHVKKYYELPEDYAHKDVNWFINRVVNEAIALSQEYPKGPVHINVPIREPLYPAAGETLSFSKKLKTVNVTPTLRSLSAGDKKSLSQSLAGFTKVLVVAGQQDYHQGQAKSVEKFCKANKVALVGDIISNLHSLSGNIRYADVFLGPCGESIKKSLQPELLITLGKSVISKNLKSYLRQYPAQHHWHIQPAGPIADTFQSLTRVVPCDPKSFFEELSSSPLIGKFELQKKENYSQLWKAEEHRTQLAYQSYFDSEAFNELNAIKELLTSLPDRCNLHLANSMSIRYANLVGLTEKNKGIHVYANRGTSGIDGCTSTALGHSLSSDVPNILITGDLAFFYDRNAFWHNYPVPNLRVIVINNHGGIIFNLIDGPGNLPEQNEYFVTNQKLSASHLANEFGFDYHKVDSSKKLKASIKQFFDFGGNTKIMEIVSSQPSAKSAFEQFKKHIKKNYES
jgi:2-succinyl-5-enolpyruvyl-6-hydroxy-3-cyclohexene-1-carboxylate synthase